MSKTVTRLCAGFSSRCVNMSGLGLGSYARRDDRQECRNEKDHPTGAFFATAPKKTFCRVLKRRGLMIEEWKERFAVGDRWRRMDGWGEKKERKKGRKGGERVRRREWITILVM